MNDSVRRIKIRLYANPSDPPATNRARGRKKRILGSVTVGYKWRNRVSITAVRRLRFPINIHVLMSNVEIEDKLSSVLKTLRTIRMAEITRIILFFIILHFLNPVLDPPKF